MELLEGQDKALSNYPAFNSKLHNKQTRGHYQNLKGYSEYLDKQGAQIN